MQADNEPEALSASLVPERLSLVSGRVSTDFMLSEWFDE